MYFEPELAAWLAARHRDGAAFLRDALARVPECSTDVLLTAFRSFTQDHAGRPLTNPTSLIAEGVTERLLTSPSTSWLPTMGTGWIGPRRCITMIANTDYSSPGLFAEACRLLRPKLVLSIGLGNATIIETAASNRIQSGKPVFDASGARIDSMKLLSPLLSNDEPLNRTLPLPWEPRASRIQSMIRTRWNLNLPFGPVSLATSARPENDYICNATAWVFGRILTNPVDLPWIGSKNNPPDLVIPSLCYQKTSAGFVHFAPMAPGQDGYVQAAITLLTDLAS